MRRSVRTRLLTVLLILILLVVAGGIWLASLGSMELGVTRYEFTTGKLSSPWKIALLSDLHNEEFGENNSLLIEKINAFAPDTILMCGDMVIKDDPDVSVVLELCEALAETADIYYIYGNHEGTLQYASDGLQIPLDRYLTARGVRVLYGGVYQIPHGDDTIDLLAKSITADQYRENPSNRAMAEAFMAKDTFKLVMSHYPDLIYDALKDMEFDLAVAGHYHGGQVILPGIGGLFHKDTGLFPEYYGGAYPLSHGTLILSRGLGNSTIFPRINNDPELILIEVRPE